MLHIIKEWVMSCGQGTKETRIDRSLTRSPQKNPNEHITAPEDAMQVDLVAEFPPSGGYESIVTDMDVFFRYFLPTRQLIRTPKRFVEFYSTSWLNTPTYQQLSSQIKAQPLFFTKLKKWQASLALLWSTQLQSRLKRWGCYNYPMRQSNRHWRLKLASEDHCGINTSVLRSFFKHLLSHKNWLWAKQSFSWPCSLQYLAYKIAISPTASTHSHFANCPRCSSSNTDDLPSKIAMQAYIKYKGYYNKKANASKLKEAGYLYILQPKADHQGKKKTFTEFRWIGPYIFAKVLPNNS